MVEGTAAQAQGWTIKDLERFRDDCIIRVLEAVEEGRAQPLAARLRYSRHLPSVE